MSDAFIPDVALHRLLFVFLTLFWGYVLKFSGTAPVDSVLFSYAFISLLIFFLFNRRVFLLNLGGMVGATAFFGFLTLFFLGVSVNIIFLDADPVFVKNLVVLVFVFFLFLTVDSPNKLFFSVKWASGFLFFILIFYVCYIIFSGVHYGNFFLDDFQANYLILADLVAISGLLTCALRIPIAIKFIVTFFVMSVLLFLGSRSAMVFYFVSIFLAFFIAFKAESVAGRLKIFIFFGASFLGLGWLIYEQKERFYRLFSLLDVAGDSSLKARGNLSEAFFTNISEGWSKIIWGAGSSTPGSYVHNILSVWQFTGILTFSAIVSLLFFAFVLIARRPYFYGKVLPLWCFCLFSCVFTRSLVSIVFPVLFSLSWLVVFRSLSRFRVNFGNS